MNYQAAKGCKGNKSCARLLHSEHLSLIVACSFQARLERLRLRPNVVGQPGSQSMR